MRKNPKLTVQDSRVYADGDRFSDATDRMEENVMIEVGPLPRFFHAANTYLLYLLRDPADQAAMVRILRGEKTGDCDWCRYETGEREFCCEYIEIESTVYDEDGNFIGTDEDDERLEELDGCSCRCRCPGIPLFLHATGNKKLGTIPHFWQNPATQMLAGAVQYIVPEERDDIVILTHMTVADDLRRNKINTFMINRIQQQHPDRNLFFDDPTDQGQAFMDHYGGEEWRD